MKNTMVEINPLLLISIYAICPILIFIALLDIFIFNRSFQSIMPNQPEEWALWVLIFNTPHIISSFITIANPKDVKKYGSSFLSAIFFIIISSILINGVLKNIETYSYFFNTLIFILYGFLTMHHVLSQQYGVSLILGKSYSRKMFFFKWNLIIISMTLYTHIFFSGGNYFIIFEIVLLIGLLYFWCDFFKNSKTKEGKIYHTGNLLLVISVFIFVNTNYDIFAFIIPRFIHDLTAFIIYSNHDKNRFELKNEPHYIYSHINTKLLNPTFLSPILGLIIANLINIISPWILIYILFVVDIFHYFIESKIWKSDSNHRLFLRIKN